jgi:hypothetical protein
MKTFQIFKSLKSLQSLTAIAAAAALFASCSQEESLPGGNAPVEIRLSSGIDLQTRAGVSVNNTQFASGEKAYAYVDDHAATTALYGNNELTADGSGGFTAATTMYFPQTGANVDIYASHPSIGTAYPTGEITHSVNTGQTDSANYSASDLLYAVSTNVARTASAVQLTFYHQLSKVRIAIAPGTGTPSLAGATVKIKGTKISAKWTPSKSAAANAQTITADGNATDITIGNDLSSADFTATLNYNEAVIVPQTLAQGTAFIEITLSSGGVLSYKIPAGGYTWQSGTVYTYHVTVNLTGLTVSSTIQDWTSAGTITGNAGM